jgi:beta-N-acetylhexosaminidase
MFLFTKNTEEDIEYMEAGVKDGVITQERLDEAITRILALKAALGLHRRKDEFENRSDNFQCPEIIGCKEHRDIARACADKSITLVKDTQNLLPITPEKFKNVLFYSLESGEGGTGVNSGGACSLFMEKLKAAGFKVTPYAPPHGFEGMMERMDSVSKNYDLIIYAANIETKSNQTVVRIEWGFPFGHDAPVYMNVVPTLFISFANPYHLLDVPRIKTYINTYGSSDAIIDALVEKLLGKSPFKGTSPIDPFCGKWDTRL